MKRIVQAAFLLLSISSFAQFSLEHTYQENFVKRIKLEISGEKYYLYDTESRSVKLYNADHTFWKAIPLQLPTGSSANGISLISETKFDPDANLEIAYHYDLDESLTGIQAESRVISENGNILLTLPNAYFLEFSEIEGLSDKFIATTVLSLENGNLDFSSQVFTLPGLALENTYLHGQVQRVMLENSGEKYALINMHSGFAEVYNSNHALWKSFDLSFPDSVISGRILFISENKINPDPLLEIGYTRQYRFNSDSTSKIVNENGLELFSIDNGGVFLNSINELSDKLLVVENQILNEFVTKVYALPSFALEHTYTNKNISRVKFETTGEKYYNTNESNGNAEIFNADHTIWKTIPLSPPLNYNVSYISHISEKMINNDNFIELSYNCTYQGSETPDFYYTTRFINENGQQLLNADGCRIAEISKIDGLETKIIGEKFVDFFVPQGAVYGHSDLNSDAFTNNIVAVFPNPATSEVQIHNNAVPIIEAKLYNVNGILVQSEKHKSIKKINVENLTTGNYFLKLTDSAGRYSTHKMLISH
ncbi:hypothetical protein FNO01nite_03940 [Flavobacterium noncentrifugens]|uniref:Por secretion system C-terminal sorting domain-containing protein n=1 Tax=Flavobacterium noncentrifugens TaxID=1128970 RepID=A0A1G8S8T9_9FLAO|nr:T9SS type A sorting domain-containing protein [Flavobacterium noncentrifugens]GEP49722.1 hypothetical protein FNO01nite_03940 [Flavobacterium noncentrifugens]SDJ25175.1 Por secretion system C-terminal sorting domain-containing protein [Flavobacterium noncentrifugens]